VIDGGVAFLLSRDPPEADHPTRSTVSSSRFKPGFPSGCVPGLLQNLQVLAELGCARDARLSRSIE